MDDRRLQTHLCFFLPLFTHLPAFLLTFSLPAFLEFSFENIALTISLLLGNLDGSLQPDANVYIPCDIQCLPHLAPPNLSLLLCKYILPCGHTESRAIIHTVVTLPLQKLVSLSRKQYFPSLYQPCISVIAQSPTHIYLLTEINHTLICIFITLLEHITLSYIYLVIRFSD